LDRGPADKMVDRANPEWCEAARSMRVVHGQAVAAATWQELGATSVLNGGHATITVPLRGSARECGDVQVG
jgi:hypothetical protein